MLTEEDYRIYADLVRFRNILAHYMMVKEEVVREIIEKRLYRRVAELALKILEALHGDP